LNQASNPIAKHDVSLNFYGPIRLFTRSVRRRDCRRAFRVNNLMRL